MAFPADELVHVQAEIAFNWVDDGVTDDVPDWDAAALGGAQAGEDVVVGMGLGDALVSVDSTPSETLLVESPLRELLPLTSPTTDDRDALRSPWSA